MTYKEISELVTERSKSIILRNARKGNCSISQDSIEVSSKPLDATERGENNIRALENYKRRIYDAWSVLRAAQIIVKVDKKHFKYNSYILEGGPEDSSELDSSVVDQERRIRATVGQLNSYSQFRRVEDQLPQEINPYANPVQEVAHEQVLQFINNTEERCRETYMRIQQRLAYLQDLSSSNLALKRLVKRNAKREAQNGKVSQSGTSNCDSEKERNCKLPFVVANYMPDPTSIRFGASGRNMGLEHLGNTVKVVSKTPIQAFDDQECLRYLNLSGDGDEEIDHMANSQSEDDHINMRENRSVKNSFFREAPNGFGILREKAPVADERSSDNRANNSFSLPR